MSNPYPTVITSEVSRRIADIPTKELREDLAEACKETVALRMAMEAYRALSVNPTEPEAKRKLHAFMVNSKKHTLEGSLELMNYLELLVHAREEHE